MRTLTPAFFIRQQDEISCGPACLATVAKLYGVQDVDYAFFRKLLDPCPKVGSCNFKMAEVSQQYLPFTSAGEDAYAGGIAVANITEDEGHYVVFLHLKGDTVVYYDPYDHEIFAKPLSNLNWISESGHLKRWAINYKPYAGNCAELWQGVAF